jgi:CubicO group peptidase (beta-lactamase class C family)
MNKHYFSGGAGLTATAYDYAIFLQMMLNGGKYNGVQLLSPRTVQMMTSGQLPFSYNGLDNFGLGFGITSERSAARGPRNKGSLTQQNPNSHGDLAMKVEQLIYQSLK